MSFVLTAPDLVQTAAQDLAGLRTALGEATTAAAPPTTAVTAAAADEVSTEIASLFNIYGREYQAVSAHAAAFHGQFVQALNAAVGSYTAAEAANASPLQAVLNAANAPAETLLGRPLIGNGANGAAGTGSGAGGNGQPGGLLFG